MDISNIIDSMVDDGVADSRSDFIRLAIEAFIKDRYWNRVDLATVVLGKDKKSKPVAVAVAAPPSTKKKPSPAKKATKVSAPKPTKLTA